MNNQDLADSIHHYNVQDEKKHKNHHICKLALYFLFIHFFILSNIILSICHSNIIDVLPETHFWWAFRSVK